MTGWTDLVLGADRRSPTVTGLLTGPHDPGAGHLDLLEPVAGVELVRAAYDVVTTGLPPYLWHEFGDTMLLLPDLVRTDAVRGVRPSRSADR